MILRAVGLRKSYVNGKTRVDAVDGADLTVAAGESISIVGRSGSGKSTLLAMIGTLTRPSEGEILIAGERVWAMSEPARSDLRRQRIGFIFQFPSLLPNSARDRQCRVAGAAWRGHRAGSRLCARS